MSEHYSAETLLEIATDLMTELHPDASRYVDIRLDSDLDRDLGLDSLARIELIARIEKRYGVRLNEEALGSAETLRDLLRYIQHAHPADAGLKPEPVEKKQDSAVRREVGFTEAETLLDVLGEHVEVQPEATHIILLEGDEEVRISYGMLQRESLKVVAKLLDLQVGQGDRVAIMLPTGQDYFYSFFGALYAGAVPVPLYPPARPTQIEEHVRRHRKILSNAGAKILITIAEVKPVARLLMSQVPELQTILTLDELYVERADQVPLAHKAEDIAFLQYTSGSTGDPKGVILSHANLLANIRAMGRVCEITAQDVFVSWLPLYHDMGLIGAWFGSLCHGCRLVVMSPLSFLARPERWLQTIDRFGGTVSASPNFGYEMCATRLDDEVLEGLDLSSWRLAVNGAEPVIPGTLQRFGNRFRKYGFKPDSLMPVYGLAESSVGLTFPAPGNGPKIDRVQRDVFSGSGVAVVTSANEPGALEFISCGRPLPGHQVRIVDESNREMPDRKEGRLQFKGPSATSGYFRNKEQTSRLFCGEWLETGDLGYIAAGEIYLTGRQKDVIIRGGRNVYPHELEDIVGEIAGIRKGCTAVFAGRQKDSTDDRLVVLTESRIRDDKKLNSLKKEVNRATIDLLGMGADEIIISPPGTVLKTSSGKIRRSACKQLYESGNIGRKKATVQLQLLRMGLASIAPMIRRIANRALSFLYAAYCWLMVGITGGVVWLLMMILPAGKWCWTLCRMAVKMLLRLTWIQVSVEGMENYPFGTRYIVVSNHMSYMDAIILMGVLPEYCNFVAKKELANNLFLRAALKKINVFLVDRFDTKKVTEDTRSIYRGVRRGRRPLFFAEGTLQRMPGLLPFQMGAFILAGEEMLPIVPLVIRGTRNILREGSWFPRRGRVQIDIGPLCHPESSDWRGAIELRDSVRRSMLSRLGEPDLAGEYTSLLQLGFKRSEKDKDPEDNK